jgi:hypothetical protein
MSRALTALKDEVKTINAHTNHRLEVPEKRNRNKP